MLENLIKLVKDHSDEGIIKNPAIPDQNNDSAIETVAKSIFESFKSHMGTGGLDKITSFFKGSDKPANQEITQGAMAGVIKNLVDKFGITEAKAKEIAEKVVPNVLKNLVSKTNDPNDSSFDFNGIVKTLSDKGEGFFNTMKKKFF